MKIIIYPTLEGTVAVVAPTPEYLETHSIEEVAAKDVPVGTQFIIVNTDTLPQDNTFFGAWELVNDVVEVNMNKAKTIGHELRRAARAEEFKPLDIKAIIPNEAVAAEAARQVIREKYVEIQINIDAASTTDEIKAALGL